MFRELRSLADRNDVAALKLTDDSRRAVEKMAAYMNLSRMGALDRELVRRDLIAMILDAQERGEPLDCVVGADQKAWCDAVSQSVGRAAPLERLLYFLYHWAGWSALYCLLIFSPSLLSAAMTPKLLFQIIICTVLLAVWSFYVAPVAAYARFWKRAAGWGGWLLILALYILMPMSFGGVILFYVRPLWIIGTLAALFLVGCFGYGAYLHRQACRMGLQGRD